MIVGGKTPETPRNVAQARTFHRPCGPPAEPYSQSPFGRQESGSCTTRTVVEFYAGLFSGSSHRHCPAGNLPCFRTGADTKPCPAWIDAQHVVCASHPLGGRWLEPSRAGP